MMDSESEFPTDGGEVGSAEQQSYAHRLVELDLEELLGKAQPPDLVAATLGRVQADASYRQYRARAQQHGVAPGFIALGFFLLAGVVLLAMPWLMRPPLPHRVPAARVPDRRVQIGPQDPPIESSGDPSSVAEEHEPLRYDLRPILGALVLKADQVVCEDEVIYTSTGPESFIDTTEILARYLLRRGDAMPEPGAPPTRMTAESAPRVVNVHLKDGRRLAVGYTEGVLLLQEEGPSKPLRLALPLVGSEDREAEETRLTEQVMTMIRPAPPLMSELLFQAGAEKVWKVRTERDIAQLPVDTVAVCCTELGDYELSVLAAQSSRLTRLVSIDLEGCIAISDVGLGVLESYPQLESLNLARTGTTDEGLRLLWRLSRLKRLYLTGCPIRDAGARTLQSFSELERLSLAGTEVTASGILALGALSKLRVLDVRYLEMGALALAALGGLEQLQTLYLGGRLYAAADLKALAGLSRLEDLTIWEPSSQQSLAFLDLLPSLKTLSVEAIRNSGECLAQLGQLVSLPTVLQDFRLVRVEPTLQLLNTLAGSYRLRSLALVDRTPTEADLVNIGRLFATQSLESLDLSTQRTPYRMGFPNYPQTNALASLKSLRVLDLTGHVIYAETMTSLRLALPLCTIRN